MTSVCFNEDASQVMSAGIDNMVKVWDLRKNAVVTEISGHTDTVTGMMLSPDGSNVLTNSMDGTVRIFDIRPFCTGERCLKVCGHHPCPKDITLLSKRFSPVTRTTLRRICSTAHGVLMVAWLPLEARTGGTLGKIHLGP